ncbi:hypothetical protein [Streptomyces kanasensis]|uniref:hypothetical protein n=1 Tax=Streptomyces kanasensis TaxID=936756 RepID=UPI0012FFBF7B|nr:hypothetical protein [Streptomyces kanasensis]
MTPTEVVGLVTSVSRTVEDAPVMRVEGTVVMTDVIWPRRRRHGEPVDTGDP